MTLSQRNFFKKIVLVSSDNKNYVLYLGIAMIVSIVAILVITALETAAVADWSFEAVTLEQRLNELKNSCSNLEMEVNRQESMAVLNEEIKNLPMFEMSAVEYLVPQESVMVAR